MGLFPPALSSHPSSKMRKVHVADKIVIPSDVQCWVKNRVVQVKGPLGTLRKSFKHTQVDISIRGKNIHVEMWFPTKKAQSAVTTIISHIRNLFTGVSKGFEYQMKFVYAHFPVNATIVDGAKGIEIRNFLGEKVNRVVTMLDGVKVARDADVNDQILLTGNDIENVSQSAALIHQICAVKKKDIRKFLDGIYVSEYGVKGDVKPY